MSAARYKGLLTLEPSAVGGADGRTWAPIVLGSDECRLVLESLAESKFLGSLRLEGEPLRLDRPRRLLRECCD